MSWQSEGCFVLVNPAQRFAFSVIEGYLELVTVNRKCLVHFSNRRSVGEWSRLGGRESAAALLGCATWAYVSTPANGVFSKLTSGWGSPNNGPGQTLDVKVGRRVDDCPKPENVSVPARPDQNLCPPFPAFSFLCSRPFQPCVFEQNLCNSE